MSAPVQSPAPFKLLKLTPAKERDLVMLLDMAVKAGGLRFAGAAYALAEEIVQLPTQSAPEAGGNTDATISEAVAPP